jgi:malate/lactate dehydrogenase
MQMQVVVVASPANTNAWVLQQFAPSIPAQNITALTRLDHNRALQHVRARLIKCLQLLHKRVADAITSS